MSEKLCTLKKSGGGAVKYVSQQWISVAANAAIPVFATQGKAQGIWVSRYMNGYSKAITFTNVNPSTGEIDNNTIYEIDSSVSTPTISNMDFVVTDNQITFTMRFSGAAHQLQMNYTY